MVSVSDPLCQAIRLLAFRYDGDKSVISEATKRWAGQTNSPAHLTKWRRLASLPAGQCLSHQYRSFGTPRMRLIPIQQSRCPNTRAPSAQQRGRRWFVVPARNEEPVVSFCLRFAHLLHLLHPLLKFRIEAIKDGIGKRYQFLLSLFVQDVNP